MSSFSFFDRPSVMNQIKYFHALTEDDVVKQVKTFTNHDFAWNKLAEKNGSLNVLKAAAVLVPLFVKGSDIHVWLTLRSNKLRHHSGIIIYFILIIHKQIYSIDI